MIAVLAFIAIFIAAYFVYKTAKDTGRNAVLWALLTIGVGFGFQIVIPLLLGIMIGIGMVLAGNSPEEIAASVDGISMVIGIICLILSFVGIGFIMRAVSKIPDEPSFAAPPSPPKFD